jgi:hypothetical protein
MEEIIMTIYALLILLLCCIVAIIILIILKNKKQQVLNRVILEKHTIEVARKDELKNYFKEEWDRQEKFLQDEIKHH